MSKNIQLPQPDSNNPLSNPLAGNAPPDVWDLQRKILNLQYAQLVRANEQFEEQETQKKGQRLQGAKDMQKRRNDEIAKQSLCPHLKPNFSPCIGGQRDHQGVYHFICGYCAKEFTGSDLPPHLRIPNEFVGGPTH